MREVTFFFLFFCSEAPTTHTHKLVSKQLRLRASSVSGNRNKKNLQQGNPGRLAGVLSGKGQSVRARSAFLVYARTHAHWGPRGQRVRREAAALIISHGREDEREREREKDVCVINP